MEGGRCQMWTRRKVEEQERNIIRGRFKGKVEMRRRGELASQLSAE